MREGLQNRSGYGIMTRYAPVAQLDRAQASDAWCRRFESCSVRQKTSRSPLRAVCLFFVSPHGFEPRRFATQGANRLWLAQDAQTLSSTLSASIGSKSCSVPSPFCDLHRFVRETLSILLMHSTYPIQNLAILRRRSKWAMACAGRPNAFLNLWRKHRF